VEDEELLALNRRAGGLGSLDSLLFVLPSTKTLGPVASRGKNIKIEKSRVRVVAVVSF
jgi:hypothetical protein